jgi:2-keto-4-pentenoate hydratase/2-oxohepta-3-ene-1,7-dioic acid hydratase in catechol pathway
VERLTVPLAIARPGKIIAVGLNYLSHCEEAGLEAPKTPMLFAHWPSALIGPGDPILLPGPAIDDRIDYEGELGVVVNETCKWVPVDAALEVVRGYCCVNDVSARSLQRDDSGGQHTVGKCVDTFDPVGAMTPASDIPDPQSLRIRTIVNNETLQDAYTSDMIFSVAEIIAYVSRTVTLDPGDLIITGSPAGVGNLREPKRFLRDGDLVTVAIDKLKPLTNPVRAVA